MPKLMRRLIHASFKEITYVSFPNEDNVYMPGFDGVLEVNQSNPYVSGLSVWDQDSDAYIRILTFRR